MGAIYRIPALVLLLLILFSGGCSWLRNPPEKIAYYALEYDPPTVVAFQTLPQVIRVDRFRVSPLYNSQKMIYREGPFERDAYVYHKWWANPGDMIADYLARDLRASELFSGVFLGERTATAGHILEGFVDAFYELDGPDIWYGVVALNITLLDATEPDITRRILLQKKYSTREICEEKTPVALAQAMSSAMYRISAAIITDIYHVLQQPPAEER